jgi:hypothetical protein
MLTRLKDDSRRGCHAYGLYLCSCGTKKIIRDDAVKRGQESCGCLRGVNLRTHGKANTPEANMLDRSKSRAKKKGFEHNITLDDINIPEFCPLLGIPLFAGQNSVCPNSPTLDRIDSAKGYVKGNVWVISYKANTIKSNATIEELEAIASKLRAKIEGRL